MDVTPVVINDLFIKKQTDPYLSPLKETADVALKCFKFSHNTNDKERI